MSECDCEETCCHNCENCRREAILNALEHNFSMRILMCLEVSGPCTFNEMATVVTDGRKAERMVFLRFHKLAEIGLVQTVRAHPGQSGAKVLRQLTPEGHRVAKRLLQFFEEMGEGCE